MANLLQDLRYALRMLWRSRGFTAVAVLTLAAGVGLNTTLFTAVNAIALRPLPVKDGAKLHRVERWFQSGNVGDVQYGFSYAEHQNYREHTRTFSDLIALSWPTRTTVVLPGAQNDEVQPARAAFAQLVSDNYFAELGAPLRAGRPLLQDDFRANAAPVVVLSAGFWKRA